MKNYLILLCLVLGKCPGHIHSYVYKILLRSEGFMLTNEMLECWVGWVLEKKTTCSLYIL